MQRSVKRRKTGGNGTESKEAQRSQTARRGQHYLHQHVELVLAGLQVHTDALAERERQNMVYSRQAHWLRETHIHIG